MNRFDNFNEIELGILVELLSTNFEITHNEKIHLLLDECFQCGVLKGYF
ncbi:MAG: hypothetical protein HUJ61_02915 [Bacilli bacterium]|nr:hypothetical protein [Bacilli bacterium]